MPDESCRKCGNELKRFSLCAECKQILRKICSKCGMICKEQFHPNCFLTIESMDKMTRTTLCE